MKILALLALLITVDYGNGQQTKIGNISLLSEAPQGYGGYARIRCDRDVTDQKFNVKMRIMSFEATRFNHWLAIDKVEADGKIIECFIGTKLFRDDIIEVTVNGKTQEKFVWVE